MKTVSVLLLPLAMLASAVTQAPTSVDYRFDEVKRNVTLTTPNQEIRVQKGHRAESGDKVATGMFSYALIAADHYKAKFEIFGSTSVQLAGGAPGVILSLERGRLHAMFDKITGSEPRVVQTPGALLAVRGTQYNVEVDKAGRTTLDVFEGTVEVRSDLRREPVLVHAGEESVFSRHDAPMEPRAMPRDRMPNGGRDMEGHGDPDGRGGHEGMHGGMGEQPGEHGVMPPSSKPSGHH